MPVVLFVSIEMGPEDPEMTLPRKKTLLAWVTTMEPELLAVP
jgi:hypothetical protein